MPQDDTLDVLDLVSASDSADNGVETVKKSVKAYSDRLKKDREKIKSEIESQTKSNLSKLLGVEINDLTQEEIDKVVKFKIENSDVVKEANRIIEENNQKLVEANISENISKIKAINPNIDNIENLTKHPQYEEIKAKIDKGYEIYDAYISVVGLNDSSAGGNPTQRKSLDSKTVSYVSPETISEATMNNYRRAFPGKSDADIIELYRRDRAE